MLAGWILSLMIALQPEAPWRDTYEATASAIDEAVHAQPSLFTDDEEGRAKTAAVLVALAWAESTFKPNAVGRGGVRGLFQIAARGGREAFDPRRASEMALELARESFRLCAGRPVGERLAVYAAGGSSCKSPPGAALAKSRYRVMKGLSLFKAHPPPSPETR